MGREDYLLKIYCLGKFKVLLFNGEEVTPKRKKACALLAILALTPSFGRSRVHLQDLLWSTFAEPQARNNLGGEIHLIKKSLGAASDVLIAKDSMLHIDRRRVWIDVLDAQTDLPARQAATRPDLLLENITIRDPEFDDWLRDQRQRLPDLLELSSAAVPQVKQARAPQRLLAALTLLPPRSSFGAGAELIAQSLGHSVGRGVSERTGAPVRQVDDPDEGVSLRVEVASDQFSTTIHVVIAVEEETRLLWTKSESVQAGPFLVMSAEHVQRLANHCIDVCILELGKYNVRFAEGASCVHAIDNINGLLTLDMSEISNAQARLQFAYDVVREPIFLAYMAYLRAFQIAELRPQDIDVLREDAERLAAHAVEQAPANATLLALMSCVLSVVLRNYEYGHELGERSVRLDPSNPLALVFLGRAKAYLGREEEGNALAQKALRLSGVGPARNSVLIFAAATAFLTKRNSEAIRLCEIVRSACPQYKAPLRMLIPLYARVGRRADAKIVDQSLQRQEPSFSLERLFEESYPSSGLRSSGLLQDLQAGL